MFGGEDALIQFNSEEEIQRKKEEEEAEKKRVEEERLKKLLPHSDVYDKLVQKWTTSGDIEGHVYSEEAKSSDGMYRGYLYNGRKWGPGTFKWANESVYNGEFVRDYPHGFGKIIHKDGGFYEGKWSYSEPQDSNGYFKSANGETYKGEISDGKKNGKGLQTFADGSSYEGEFDNDKKQG